MHSEMRASRLKYCCVLQEKLNSYIADSVIANICYFTCGLKSTAAASFKPNTSLVLLAEYATSGLQDQEN
jgi:hypothetical protein